MWATACANALSSRCFYTKTPPASHFSSDLPQFGGKTSTVKTSFLITTLIFTSARQGVVS
jgi:hypothetical protein